jgi:hypothetical protein
MKELLNTPLSVVGIGGEYEESFLNWGFIMLRISPFQLIFRTKSHYELLFAEAEYRLLDKHGLPNKPFKLKTIELSYKSQISFSVSFKQESRK